MNAIYKKVLRILAVYVLLPSSLIAQQLEIVNNQAVHFQLKDKRGDIDFLVVDTVLNQKKPVLLYCQGSMPMPLFFADFGPHGIFLFGGGISNFDLPAIRKQYLWW